MMPQMRQLNYKETQLNALKFVGEVASQSYKTLQEENNSMGKIIESIMRTSRGSVSFTNADDTNTTTNPYINGSTYFQQSSQVQCNIMQT